MSRRREYVLVFGLCLYYKGRLCPPSPLPPLGAEWCEMVNVVRFNSDAQKCNKIKLLEDPLFIQKKVQWPFHFLACVAVALGARGFIFPAPANFFFSKRANAEPLQFAYFPHNT